MPFVDLHCHILPALDDGPSTLAETLAMLRLAHAGGTRALVATPHLFLAPYELSDPVVLGHSFDRLVDQLESVGKEDQHSFLNEMTLYLGAENYVCPEFFAALEEGSVVALNNSRYLLIEFAPYFSLDVAVAAVERILGTGYVPVLAHVERYPFFQKIPHRLAGFREMGCVAQVNASTLAGASGRRLARRAGSLLEEGLAQVVASDGHGLRTRRPDLSRAVLALKEGGLGAGVARWMWDNPARILADKPLV